MTRFHLYNVPEVAKNWKRRITYLVARGVDGEETWVVSIVTYLWGWYS